MKVYKINERQFVDIKKHQMHWEFYNNFDKYLEEHDDDLMFYERLNKCTTNMNFQIFIEVSMSYIAFNHPLWLYAKDKNGKYVPFSICRLPQILVNRDAYPFDFSDEEINEIKSFIVKNYYALHEYGRMNMNRQVFFECLKRFETYKHLLLTEMPVFTKEELGTPTDIWVDGERGMKHGPRIKFRSENGNNTRNWSTCTISDEPQIMNLPNKTFLDSKDLRKIKNFVIYNKDFLLSLTKGVNGMMKDEDILKRFVKLGKNGGPIYSKEFFEEPFIFNHDSNKIDIYLKYYGHGITFIGKGNGSEKLIKILGSIKGYKVDTPYSVTFTDVTFDSGNIINWRSEMNAIEKLKKIANSNGFNVKIHNT